jgi:hypothetical protein
MVMYRARVGQSALRRGGGVDRRAVLEQPNLVLYPELLELADDIVYYAPEFNLFLPGDTGSSRAVGPPRWGILVAHILPRAPGEDGQ